jgi:hypothetical protein
MLGFMATIYTFGLLPAALLINETRYVAQREEYREPIYRYYTEEVLVEEERPIYKTIEVMPDVEKMIPLARKMVKEEMKKEVMEHQVS